MTRKGPKQYPVVDLFAGPGGLGEGFAALYENNNYCFQSEISIEHDQFAHRTLLLRHFFRSFGPGAAPSEYYQYLSGKLRLADLADMYPGEWQNASNSALCISLGKTTHRKVSQKISDKLRGHEKWALVGGPPCQAYSLVGRSRRAKDPDFETDEKHFRYREYLNIRALRTRNCLMPPNKGA